ncbi:MAG TPA: hypothetical protein VMN57_16945 [Anaerolineales bacterium]|nr:hypothetical protein [Anaerolineales bacterium]
MDHKDALTSEHICPFIGLRNDRDTRYGFPNEGNHCHRERSPRTINLDYQEGVCLTSGFLNCPIYLHSGGNIPVGVAGANARIIQREGNSNAAASNRTVSSPRNARTDGTAWMMLDEVEAQPEKQGGRSLFGYSWFRLFFGLLLVIGSVSGMLLLMQGTDFGGIGSNGTVATATPFGGVLPLDSTATPETQTATLLPSPTFTLPPTGTPLPSATITTSPTVTPTGSQTETPTPTPNPTNTSPPFIFPSNTPLPTWTPTPTSTPPPTNTPIPPTNTPVPPTNTPVPPTNTPVPPTNTPISDLPTPTP